MDEMEKTIAKKDWKYLVKNFLPVNFADTLTFPEGMHLVGNLVKAAEDETERGGFTADLFRDFAVNLMIILRAKNPKEWEKDWKNEAFLGIACAFVYREEEAFAYIKNAYDKLDDPPQSLIFALISAGSRPDHLLTRVEVSSLTQEAIKKGITYESSERMATLEQDMGDQEKCEYWKQKAAEAHEQKLHTPIITPDILKSMFELEGGYHHEN